MNEQVKIFDNPEFGQIRTIEQENKVWFGATDVATALGYSNPRDAIVRHCKSAGVVNHDVGVQTGIKSDGSPSIQNITMKFIILAQRNPQIFSLWEELSDFSLFC